MMHKTMANAERRLSKQEFQRLTAESAAQGSSTVLEILAYYAAFEPVEY
ncbi:MAG: hypothetical protein SF123_24180 [Chloroflexota bacterium]|nr:hypothetical protein [Chloroflexota bacterium]